MMGIVVHCGQVAARVAGAVRNGCPSRQTGRTVSEFVGTKSVV